MTVAAEMFDKLEQLIKDEVEMMIRNRIRDLKEAYVPSSESDGSSCVLATYEGTVTVLDAGDGAGGEPSDIVLDAGRRLAELRGDSVESDQVECLLAVRESGGGANVTMPVKGSIEFTPRAGVCRLKRLITRRIGEEFKAVESGSEKSVRIGSIPGSHAIDLVDCLPDEGQDSVRAQDNDERRVSIRVDVPIELYVYSCESADAGVVLEDS